MTSLTWESVCSPENHFLCCCPEWVSRDGVKGDATVVPGRRVRLRRGQDPGLSILPDRGRVQPEAGKHRHFSRGQQILDGVAKKH